MVLDEAGQLRKIFCPIEMQILLAIWSYHLRQGHHIFWICLVTRIEKSWYRTSSGDNIREERRRRDNIVGNTFGGIGWGEVTRAGHRAWGVKDVMANDQWNTCWLFQADPFDRNHRLLQGYGCIMPKISIDITGSNCSGIMHIFEKFYFRLTCSYLLQKREQAI